MDDGYLIQPSFPSTHPVWGGTPGSHGDMVRPVFQSTHPVWGGTSALIVRCISRRISIHPPRVGWDATVPHELINHTDFNPPTPCGVGLDYLTTNTTKGSISIHPPRVGWDKLSIADPIGKVNFNPPTPCGVGLWLAIFVIWIIRFQSTHPVWGGTW